MSARDSETETMQEAEARIRWSDVLNRVSRQEKRVLIEQDGSPVAALVSVDDYERLVQLDRQREERFKALDESRTAFKDVPDEVLEAEVAKAVAEAREQTRQELQRQRSTRSA